MFRLNMYGITKTKKTFQELIVRTLKPKKWNFLILMKFKYIVAMDNWDIFGVGDNFLKKALLWLHTVEYSLYRCISRPQIHNYEHNTGTGYDKNKI